MFACSAGGPGFDSRLRRINRVSQRTIASEQRMLSDALCRGCRWPWSSPYKPLYPESGLLEPLGSGCRRLEPLYSWCSIYWNHLESSVLEPLCSGCGVMKPLYSWYSIYRNSYILRAGYSRFWVRCTGFSMFWVRCTGTWSADVGWLGCSAGQLVPADRSAGCPGRGQHAHHSSAGDQPTLSALSSSYLCPNL